MKKIILFIALLLFSNPFLHADTKTIGEIVNLTQQHQVAFTDLTSSQVAVGDIVEIFQGQEFLTYLEVVETSKAVSKLGYVQKSGLATSINGFNKISIGSKVVRLELGTKKSFDAVLSQINNLQQQNAQLSSALEAKTKELENIQKQKSQDQEKLKLIKEKFSALKAALNQSNP